jgi:hypothetical protein
MNQTLIYSIRGKHQPKEDPWAKSPLAGLPASRMSITAHSPTSSEASRKESRNTTISSEPKNDSTYLRLTQDRLGRQLSADKFPALPEAPKRGLEHGKLSASPDPGLWCCFPIGALEAPIPSPTFSSQPVGQARMDKGQITMSWPITAAADHYTTHTVTVYMTQACTAPL